MRTRDSEQLAFEDSLSEDWGRDLETVEVSLDGSSGRWIALAAGVILAIVLGRVFYLTVFRGNYYAARAATNVNHIDRLLAPRGLITDRFGTVLAENQPVFSAVLNLQQYLRNPALREPTLAAAESILNVPRADVEAQIEDAQAHDSGQPIVIATDLTQPQVVAIAAKALPTLSTENDFKRTYPDSRDFSTVLGYVGRPNAADLEGSPNLSSEDLVGKAGIEAFYDDRLQGTPGAYLKVRDAHGAVLSEQRTAEPKIGATLQLTLDAEFQRYFAARMEQGMANLGRTSGAAIAINPQTGEILSLLSFPQYDNGIMSNSGNNDVKTQYLTSKDKPLFDRAVSGAYSPGSTIKPLVGIAALKEGVISPDRTIFSPGYLDIPNKYDPTKPTRYLDWRPQGNVDLAAALAQSSDVYFYEVGGGFGDIKGLGITKLVQWWQKFLLGKRTGIDLPAETTGFLPTPDWKKQRDGRDWLLGDTFNVSIGQGDLDITPIQLIDYIGSVANGGTIWKPHLAASTTPQALATMTDLQPQIAEVQKGMRRGVTNPLGTSYLLHDLPFPVDAKTGSAQVLNNTQENAFFVGYIPATASGVDNGSQIAILILIEHSKEGSLNTIPIAKDVLNWYWNHRLAPK